MLARPHSPDQPDTARRPPAFAPVPAPRPAVVQALQRTAGNAAVTAALSRQPRQALQRCQCAHGHDDGALTLALAETARARDTLEPPRVQRQVVSSSPARLVQRSGDKPWEDIGADWAPTNPEEAEVIRDAFQDKCPTRSVPQQPQGPWSDPVEKDQMRLEGEEEYLDAENRAADAAREGATETTTETATEVATETTTEGGAEAVAEGLAGAGEGAAGMGVAELGLVGAAGFAGYKIGQAVGEDIIDPYLNRPHTEQLSEEELAKEQQQIHDPTITNYADTVDESYKDTWAYKINQWLED